MEHWCIFLQFGTECKSDADAFLSITGRCMDVVSDNFVKFVGDTNVLIKLKSPI